MTGHFNGMNGTDTLLFDITAVSSIAAFLLQRVVHGEGFGSQSDLILLGKCPDVFARLSGRHYSLRFRRLFVQLRACYIYSTVKLQIVSAAI